jgi:hypothetical protein
MFDEIWTWADGQQAAYRIYHDKKYLLHLQTLKTFDMPEGRKEDWANHIAEMEEKTKESLRSSLTILKRTNTPIPRIKPKPRVSKKFKADFTDSKYKKIIDKASAEQKQAADKKYGTLTVELVLDGNMVSGRGGTFFVDRSLIRMYVTKDILRHELGHFVQDYLDTLLRTTTFGQPSKKMREETDDKTHALLNVEFFTNLITLVEQLRNKQPQNKAELYSWLGTGPEVEGFETEPKLQLMKKKAPQKWQRAVKELLKSYKVS